MCSASGAPSRSWLVSERANPIFVPRVSIAEAVPTVRSQRGADAGFPCRSTARVLPMHRRLALRIGEQILRFLCKPTWRYAPFFAPDSARLRRALRPGDVLLVEGNSRLSATIKFLT